MLKVPGLLFSFQLANVPQGGKRPYHTIIPALATRGNDLFLSFGVMGAFMQASHHHLFSYFDAIRPSGCHSPKGKFRCC